MHKIYIFTVLLVFLSCFSQQHLSLSLFSRVSSVSFPKTPTQKTHSVSISGKDRKKVRALLIVCELATNSHSGGVSTQHTAETHTDTESGLLLIGLEKAEIFWISQ